MAKSKKAKKESYNRLRSLHFTHSEAQQYCKLRDRDPALIQLEAIRSRQYRNFLNRVKKNEWTSAPKIKREWQQTLLRSYRSRRCLVWWGPHKGEPSPWELWRNIYDRLPPDLQKGYPKQKDKSQARREKLDIKQVKTRKWIADLTSSIKRSTGQQKKDFINQRDRL